jgi:MATE family multidrug resistance protein
MMAAALPQQRHADAKMLVLSNEQQQPPNSSTITTALIDSNAAISNDRHNGSNIHQTRAEVLQEAKALLHIALPTLVTQLGFVVPPFLAASYVGRYFGHVYLAGFQLAFLTVNLFTLSLLTGLFSAADTLAPQAFGAGNYPEVGIVSLRSLVGSLVVILPAGILLGVYMTDVLISLGEDPVASVHATQWYRIFVVALPFYGLYMALWKFLSAQNVMQPLVIASAISLLVILPLSMEYFIQWFGFLGSAMSFALYQISQALLVLGILWVYRPHRAECWPGLQEAWGQVFAWKPFAQFLHLGMGGILASSECKTEKCIGL